MEEFGNSAQIWVNAQNGEKRNEYLVEVAFRAKRFFDQKKCADFPLRKILLATPELKRKPPKLFKEITQTFQGNHPNFLTKPTPKRFNAHYLTQRALKPFNERLNLTFNERPHKPHAGKQVSAARRAA